MGDTPSLVQDCQQKAEAEQAERPQQVSLEDSQLHRRLRRCHYGRDLAQLGLSGFPPVAASLDGNRQGNSFTVVRAVLRFRRGRRIWLQGRVVVSFRHRSLVWLRFHASPAPSVRLSAGSLSTFITR